MRLADEDGLHLHFAARAEFMRLGRDFGAIRLRAAMGTEFRAYEHHPETGGTGHRGEPRPAMFALRRLRGDRRAAHRAIECFHRHWQIASLNPAQTASRERL